ncbi:N-6 DNA methylase [Paenibacillus camerounensis]|uniref:N-6 DNA methylase n=1 Tax=Paenibacillus camerounensis TaxID=1243663 RepID=UPI0005A91B29|nr:N-6 DNA methylase [Paenibacillus camerounensis]
MILYDQHSRRERYANWKLISSELIETISRKIASLYANGNVSDILESWIEINDIKVNEHDFILQTEKEIEKLLYLFTLKTLFLQKYSLKDFPATHSFRELLILHRSNVDSDQSSDHSMMFYYKILSFYDEYIVHEAHKNLYFDFINEFHHQLDLMALVSIYEDVISNKERKDMGKFFTEGTISKLIAALTISKESKRILDPMCGTGLFITSAMELLEQGDSGVTKEFIGFEINPVTAEIANLLFKIYSVEGNNQHIVKIMNVDAFNPMIREHKAPDLYTENLRQEKIAPFDVVFGNPAYIRYQNLWKLFKFIPNEFKQAYISFYKVALDDTKLQGQFVSHYIRAGLLGGVNNDEHFIEQLEWLRKNKHSFEEDELFWFNLVNGYSGLSDLTVPTWLLAYSLCRTDGKIGFITSNSWFNRDYGAILKLFFLQLTELEYVMDLSNINAFEDAQVSTSIVITKKKVPKLQNRVKFIKFKQIDNLNVSLHEIMRRILENSNQYDGEYSIELQFKKWLEALDDNWEDDFIRINVVEQSDLAGELMEDKKARRLLTAPIKKVSSSIKKWSDLFQKESALDQLYSPEKWISIERLPIEVNQGVRTGYNSFFYFEKMNYRNLVNHGLLVGKLKEDAYADCSWEDLFCKKLVSVNDLKALSFQTPVNYDQLHEEYLLVVYQRVDLNQKDLRLAFIRKRYLKKVVRSIKDLSHYFVLNDELEHYIFISDKGILAKDYETLETKFTSDELRTWQEAGLHIFDESTAQYIEEAAKLRVQKNEGIIYIPDMPVLQGYHNKPTLQNVPAFWYSLGLRERHVGNIFVNRINYKEMPFIMNDIQDPYVIDANFITMTLYGLDEKHLLIYFAILNSSLLRLQLEKNCSVMGGGALKVEATHLRKIVLPNLRVFSERQLYRLYKLGEKLKNASLVSKEICDELDMLLLEVVLDTERGTEGILQEAKTIIDFLTKERLKK